MPRMSFILPVYNVRKELPRVTQSLQAQTMTDFEAIFVDDGSVDGSGAWLDAAAQEEMRFQVVHQPNRGVAQARNAALDRATGDYLFFLDPDDWIEPQTAQVLLDAAEAHGADMVLFGRWHDVYDAKGTCVSTRLDAPPITGVYRENVFQTHFDALATAYFVTNKLFRRSFVSGYQGRFPAQSIGEDALFCLAAWQQEPRCVVAIPDALYHYTQARSGSLTNRFHPERLRDNFVLSQTLRDMVAQWGLLGQERYCRKVMYATVRDLMLGMKYLGMSQLSLWQKQRVLHSWLEDAWVARSVRETPLRALHGRNDRIKLLMVRTAALFAGRWHALGQKGKRLACYGRELALMVLLRPVAWVLRRTNASYRNVWLVAERGHDARDNGYWLYRHLHQTAPERNVWYVITPDSPDAGRVKALGNVVAYRSMAHYLRYYCADVLAGTHVQPCAPDLMCHYHLAKHGLRARGKQVFLQHGILQNDMHWQDAAHMHIDLFACGGHAEFLHVRDTYGYAPGVVQELGLCRFDRLMQAKKPKKQVLLMPTWRGAHYPKGAAFPQTAFYRHYQQLLENPALHALLERYQMQLVFFPHVEMQGELHHFHVSSPCITLAKSDTHDVQQLLMESAILITDYSSVAFDMAYMRKCVLYDQFDREEFHRVHYGKGYFDFAQMGFGPVCETEEKLLDALTLACKANGAPAPEFCQRMDDFFPQRDEMNCQRTEEAILGLFSKENLLPGRKKASPS